MHTLGREASRTLPARLLPYHLTRHEQVDKTGQQASNQAKQPNPQSIRFKIQPTLSSPLLPISISLSISLSHSLSPSPSLMPKRSSRSAVSLPPPRNVRACISFLSGSQSSGSAALLLLQNESEAHRRPKASTLDLSSVESGLLM